MDKSVGFLNALKVELPHRPAVPLLGIDPKKLKSGSLRETHAPMLMTEPSVHNSHTSVHGWMHA